MWNDQSREVYRGSLPCSEPRFIPKFRPRGSRLVQCDGVPCTKRLPEAGRFAPVSSHSCRKRRRSVRAAPVVHSYLRPQTGKASPSRTRSTRLRSKEGYMNQQAKYKLIGFIMMFASSSLMGGIGAFTRFIDAPGDFVSFWRNFAGLIALSLIFCFVGGSWKKIKETRFSGMMLLSGVFLGLLSGLYCLSTQYTTLANASFLIYTGPIYSTILAAIFLKEKLNIKGVLCIAAVVVGMLFIVGIVTPEGLTLDLDPKYTFGNAIAFAFRRGLRPVPVLLALPRGLRLQRPLLVELPVRLAVHRRAARLAPLLPAAAVLHRDGQRRDAVRRLGPDHHPRVEHVHDARLVLGRAHRRSAHHRLRRVLPAHPFATKRLQAGEWPPSLTRRPSWRRFSACSCSARP